MLLIVSTFLTSNEKITEIFYSSYIPKAEKVASDVSKGDSSNYTYAFLISCLILQSSKIWWAVKKQYIQLSCMEVKHNRF